MFSEEALALTEKMVKAIKALAKRQEVECPQCKGHGYGLSPLPGLDSMCPKCHGHRKVGGKWKWEPERYDHFILPTMGMQHGVVWSFDKKTTKLIYLGDAPDQADIDCCICAVEYKHAVPLLSWEKIGKILRSFNYTIVVNINFHHIGGKKPYAIPQDIWDNASEYKNSRVIYSCDIYTAVGEPKRRFILTAFGKDYQHSVMLAVVELAKEMEK